MYCFETSDGKLIFQEDYVAVEKNVESDTLLPCSKENGMGAVLQGTPYSFTFFEYSDSEEPVEKPLIDNISTVKIIEEAEWSEEIQEEYNTILCDEAKMAKISELVALNDLAIDAGTTVTLSTGEENFTYTLADQSNISEMFMAVVMGATEYSYHQNGETCHMFNAGDIITLYGTLSMYKTNLLTYFNQLKNYVGSLTSVEDIQAVTYGQELTGEYLASYNDLMAKNKAQLDKVIENLTQKGE